MKISRHLEKANKAIDQAREELFKVIIQIFDKKKIKKHEFSDANVYVTDEEACERMAVKEIQIDNTDVFMSDAFASRTITAHFVDGTYIELTDIGTDDLHMVADSLYSELCFK